MNNTISQTEELISTLSNSLPNPIPFVKILLCPPFVNILKAREISFGYPFHIGAQNCHTDHHGAFTGEVSAKMLKSVGCEYVIVGHSERRAYFNEDDSFINKKIKVILETAMTPILCIGESLEQRRNGSTNDILKRQLEGCFEGIPSDDIKQIVIAYEPI